MMLGLGKYTFIQKKAAGNHHLLRKAKERIPYRLLYRILIIEKCQKRYLSARSNKANRVRINVNFNSCEAYVVKFKAKLKVFEYYTFYDSKTEYEEDKQANLIMLRKQLVSRALESMMGNSTSELYAYMKPNTVIIPEIIIKYVSAKEWRKKCT